MTDRPDQPVAAPRVAVIVPCHNEALTVGPLVEGIVEHLPGARVVVIDNDSSDATAARARIAGAEVMSVSRRARGTRCARPSTTWTRTST
jgi:glycosyltransferase involved in cell wall biosynthesis